MSWLYITILVYFILAFVNLIDKYLLQSVIPNYKVYSFYVGILSILALVLAPFTGFYIPKISLILLGFAAGASYVYGLFWFYKTLNAFEASRVVPAVGSLTPIFTFVLIYLVSGSKEDLTLSGLIAFLLLILGSILIVFKKSRFVNLRSFKFSLISAFFLSLSFVLAKYLYLSLPFWTAFIWKSMGGVLLAICFFFRFPDIRKEVFSSLERLRQRESHAAPPKNAVLFLGNQAMGAGAAILQNWAIALAPLAYVAFINALQGMQYVFLFLIAVFLSLYFPRILKEDISRKVIIQKIIAIFVIGAGLVMLAL